MRQHSQPAYYPHTCRLIVQHLPKALLLALIVAEPAMAVDYLRCEAMQRAYARLVNQRVDFIVENYKPTEEAKLFDLCHFDVTKDPTDPTNERYYAIFKKERFLMGTGELSEKMSKCLSNPENTAKAKAAAIKKIHPMNREKIAKVAADLKAAKCP